MEETHLWPAPMLNILAVFTKIGHPLKKFINISVSRLTHVSHRSITVFMRLHQSRLPRLSFYRQLHVVPGVRSALLNNRCHEYGYVGNVLSQGQERKKYDWTFDSKEPDSGTHILPTARQGLVQLRSGTREIWVQR